MTKFASLLALVILVVPLLAQSADSDAVREGRYALTTLTKYCDAVEKFSNSEVPRIFAQIGSGSNWMEFSGSDAWKRAGKPQPLALVWYRNDAVARVVIKAKGGSGDGQWYADYCYRPDGSLARLRSVPETQTDCDPSLFHCTFTIQGERLYPPKALELVKPCPKDGGQRPVVVKADSLDWYDVLLRPLQSERTSISFAPMEWPEYLTVRDLPFNPLLYVSTR